MSTIANITVSSLENRKDVKVINISGELDESNLEEFENIINPLVQEMENKVLIFNLLGLNFMNSKAIGYFAYLYTTLSKDQRRIIFAVFNQNIKDIMGLVGLDKLIECAPTLEEAIQTAYRTTEAK